VWTPLSAARGSRASCCSRSSSTPSSTPHGILPKWTLVPATNASQELLELVAFVCGGVAFTPALVCLWAVP